MITDGNCSSLNRILSKWVEFSLLNEYAEKGSARCVSFIGDLAAPYSSLEPKLIKVFKLINFENFIKFLTDNKC